MNRLLRSASLVVFVLAATGAPARAQPTLLLMHSFQSPNPNADGGFGATVSGVPDVNGDGRGDVLIGSLESIPIASQAGRAYAFSGATGLVLDTRLSPNFQINGRFGLQVVGLRDLNGDGRGEYLIAAPYEDGGAASAGRVYLVAGITGTVLRTLTSPNVESGGLFGIGLAAVPDANGDGVEDLLVGAIRENLPGFNDAGRAYLFSGATGALLRTLISPNPEGSGNFGIEVAGVPDVNGDGRGDLIVAAHFENGAGVQDAGRVYLFSGSSGALLRTFVSPNPEQSGRFGASVAGVTDTDGDGRGDLLVGASTEDHAGISASGRAYLFSGSTGVLLHTLVSPAPEQSGTFGSAVAAMPDLTGDGRGDLVIAAALESEAGVATSGRVYLFSGATGGLIARAVSPNLEEVGIFGNSISAVPDADGDGRADLAVGASNENGGAADAGRAYLFSTNLVVAAEPEPGEAALALTAAPNPASIAATLTFTLRRPGPVRLAVYDALGREVAVLLDGVRLAGPHEAALDAAALPPGVYLARLEAGGLAVTRRVAIAR